MSQCCGKCEFGATPDTALVAYVTDGGGDIKRRKRPPALVSWCGNKVRAGEDRPRLGSKEASATPLAFRDALLTIARGDT